MAHLLIITGPGAGAECPLDGARIVLGRDKACDIKLKLDDPEREKHISGRHALITRDADDNFSIEDGNGKGKPSKNHTFVNDCQIPFPEKVPLKDGDIIRIFDFTFAFVADSSIQVAISHQSGSAFAQTAEKLKLILEFGKKIGATLDIDALMPQIVESLLALFKYADRVVMIEVDQSSGNSVIRVQANRAAQTPLPGFSEAIVKQCLRTVEGLLSNEPKGLLSTNPKTQFQESDSVADLAIESVMCCPLWDHTGKAFGVLLLDSRNPKKKFTEDDLSFLMGVAHIASAALANARYHRDALVRERLSRDLSLARQVVLSFLPARLPEIPGYEFFAASESALEVGGDYYDFQPLKDGRLCILVGDVAGKGIAAALVMARFSAEARACLRTEPDVAAAIRQLNDLMQPLNLTDRFVTLATLVLDTTKHTLTIVNAAHPPPLLVRGTPRAVTEAASRDAIGPPVAVIEGYAYEAQQITLEPGDSIILFSDGITEAMDASDSPRPFGVEALYDRLKGAGKSPRQLGARILQCVKDHAAGCAQHDDITLVCFGRLA